MSAPATRTEDLKTLHLINTLFAPLTGHDLYLAAQIRDAIRFHLDELPPAPLPSTASAPATGGTAATPPPSFYAVATRLLQTCLGQHAPERGFYHWDAAQNPATATPLFARDQILNGLKALAPYRAATLLITNLRTALLPARPRRRHAPKHLRDYEELVGLIRDLSADHATPHSQLQLLFL